MAGRIYSGTYTNTILLTNSATQNPVTLTGSITANGLNASSDSGFYSNVNFAWTINNLGRITTSGATSYGIALLHGGTINNGAVGSTLGIIQSDETGIQLTGAAGQVTNDGTIIGTLGRGVFLQAGGTLTNGAAGATAATIKGGFVGVAIYNAGGQLTNLGTILSTGTAGFGVEVYAGSVSNLAGGVIGGTYGVGLVGHTLTGTVTNAGTITGTGRDGVALTSGGTVTNSGTITGAIAGVLALYGAGTVTNSGMLRGVYAGVDLLAGGVVTNLAAGRISGSFGVSTGNGRNLAPLGTVTNAGIITGSTYEGVSLAAGGSLNNTGSIYGFAGGAVAFYGAAGIINSGSIGASFVGVKLATGGTLTNSRGGTISGSYGVVLANGPLTGGAQTPTSLANAGVISGLGSMGLDVLTNGSFVNQAGGSILGGSYGAYIDSVTGTIANYGAISGRIGIYGKAVLANNQTYPGQLTIINAGTITGSSGTSVSMFASHDLLIDQPGAVFIGTVQGGGGKLELAAGTTRGNIGDVGAGLATFSTITVDAGANWSIYGTLAASATLMDVGALSVAGASFSTLGTITGTGSIGIGRLGTVTVSGTSSASTSFVFTDPSARLILTNPASDASTDIGFAAGNTIYLSSLPNAGLSKLYVPGVGGGSLAIKRSGTLVANIAFKGSYTTSSFALATDPNGGTDLLIPCFLAGTLIATASGTAPVETLCVGNQVRTASGAVREITWIGHRAIDLSRHPEPARVQPIRIARGAFGHTIPQRDLFLSPDHAILHEGALIPIGLLVNNGSVRQETLAHARYYHVELASHDILLAEAMPVESFLDTGNRCLLGIAESDSTARLPAWPCAPLVVGGSALARARRHLLVQSRRHRRPAPDLSLLCGPSEIAPVRRMDQRRLYLLPQGAMRLTLQSTAPCMIAGIILDGVVLDPCGPAYAQGFAPPTCDRRGTLRRMQQSAELTLPAGTAARRSLEVVLAA